MGLQNVLRQCVYSEAANGTTSSAAFHAIHPLVTSGQKQCFSSSDAATTAGMQRSAQVNVAHCRERPHSSGRMGTQLYDSLGSLVVTYRWG